MLAMNKRGIQKLVEQLGGPTKLAMQFKSPRRRGKTLTTAAVSKWERIPPEYCARITELARARGVAVTLQQLRPDVFGQAAA